MDDLAKWINDELAKREWSQRELGRRAGVSNSTISKVAAGEIEATWDFCAAIGRALGERPEVIFRMAGLLPPSSGKVDDLSEDEAEWLEVYRSLSPDQRKTILGIVLGWRDRLKRRG